MGRNELFPVAILFTCGVLRGFLRLSRSEKHFFSFVYMDEAASLKALKLLYSLVTQRTQI